MRDASRYRGARRATLKALWTEWKHQGFLSFVDAWRQQMPQDSAASIRSTDWQRRNAKLEARHASHQSAA